MYLLVLLNSIVAFKLYDLIIKVNISNKNQKYLVFHKKNKHLNKIVLKKMYLKYSSFIRSYMFLKL